MQRIFCSFLFLIAGFSVSLAVCVSEVNVFFLNWCELPWFAVDYRVNDMKNNLNRTFFFFFLLLGLGYISLIASVYEYVTGY